MIHLHSLRLLGTGYKLLRDGAELRIADWGKPITVLIGENGSGKSTVLECLTWVFRALHERYVMGRAQARPPFEFELVYVIEPAGGPAPAEVRFDGLFPAAPAPQPALLATGQRNAAGKYELKLSPAVLRQNAAGHWQTVPQKGKISDYKAVIPNLVVYYSGLSESIESIYKEFEREYRTSLLPEARQSQDAYAKLRVFPVYYLERGHFELLLAALYSYEYSDDINIFFAERLGIEKPAERCIRLVVAHHQYKPKKTAAEFWGAEGELGLFLARIRECATAETAGAEQSLTFEFDLAGWYRLREQYVEERLLLTLLLLLRSERLLAALEVFYNLPGQPRVSHLHMSEGQQQLITLRALNELMVGDNTLFLFDEPDTYLHPKWQAAFMGELEPFTARATFLVTTHSPLLLANFRGGNLFAMKAGQARLIEGHYYGRTYGDSLRDIMHTDVRPVDTEAKFLVLFDLLDRQDWDEADEKLAELRELVGPDDSELVKAGTMLELLRPEETSAEAAA